jgi:hypothetical protein
MIRDTTCFNTTRHNTTRHKFRILCVHHKSIYIINHLMHNEISNMHHKSNIHLKLLSIVKYLMCIITLLICIELISHINNINDEQYC